MFIRCDLMVPATFISHHTSIWNANFLICTSGVSAVQRQDINHVEPLSAKHDYGMFISGVKPYAADCYVLMMGQSQQTSFQCWASVNKKIGAHGDEPVYLCRVNVSPQSAALAKYK